MLKLCLSYREKMKKPGLGNLSSPPPDNLKWKATYIQTMGLLSSIARTVYERRHGLRRTVIAALDLQKTDHRYGDPALSFLMTLYSG